MTVLNFRQVTVLPASPELNTLYLLKSGSAVQFFVTGPADATLLPVVSAQDDNLDDFLLMGVTGVTDSG